MEPWEELDVDDSDVISFSLRRCKRSASHPLTLNNPRPNLSSSSSSSSSSPRLIPGPAGAVQAAMRRRTQINRHHAHEEEPITTQEFLRRVVEDGDDQDADFNKNPWLCALDFVTRQGADSPTPLGSIRKGVETHRVAQVVAIIKSCNPNGLGDLMLTLKDPTGTIGASIHHTALSERDFGKSISVGAVLVLQRVAVFSPSRSACYLNITKNNLVQVISKESGPLRTKDLPTTSDNNPAPNHGTCNNLCIPQEKFPPSQESTERIMNYLRQNSNARGSELNIEKLMETDDGCSQGMSFSRHKQRESQNAGDVEVLSSLVRRVMPDGVTGVAVREESIDDDRVTVLNPGGAVEGGNLSSFTQSMNHATVGPEKRNLGKFVEGENALSMTQPIGASSAPSSSVHGEQVGRAAGPKRQRQPLIWRTSVPEYTEEELDLFEFD